MAIDKIRLLSLNADDDKRLVDSSKGEMTSAYNVSVTESGEGTGSVVNAAMGNGAVLASNVNSMMEGEHQIIGQVADPQTGNIYFAAAAIDDPAKDTIYRFSASSNTYGIVLKDNRLNLSAESFVKMDVINNVGQNNQTILYFTDNINPPRKINVDRAIAGLYDNLSDSEFNYSVNSIKAAPVYPPSASFITDDSIPHNNFKKDVYQFATQLIYKDGEESAISPYSELLVPKHVLLAGNEGEEFVYSDLSNNVCVINLKIITELQSLNDVAEVRILAKIGNEGTFYVVDQLDPKTNKTKSVFGEQDVEVYNAGTQNYFFYNDTLGAFVPEFTVNKMYDNVPFTAEGQAISGNRLMYSNYTEGRQNHNVRARITPKYLKRNQQDSRDSFGAFPGFTLPELFPGISFRIGAGFLNLGYQSIDSDIIEAGQQLTLDFMFGPEISSISGLNISGFIDIPGSSGYNVSSGEFNPFSAPQVINQQPVQWQYSSGSNQSIISFINDFATFISSQQVTVDYTSTPIPGVDNLFDIPKLVFQSAENAAQIDFGPVLVKCKKIEVTWSFLTQVNQSTGTIEVQPFISSLSIPDLITTGIAFEAARLVFDPNNFPDGLPSELLSPTAAQDGEPYITEFSVNNETDYQIDGGQSFFSVSGYFQDEFSLKGFKSGGLHRFGIVYYDEYNRSGFVNEIGSGYAGWYNNPGRLESGPLTQVVNSENSFGGPVSFEIDLTGQPVPSWAKSYQIVTPGSATVADFVQYTVGGAFLKRKGEIDSSTTRPLDEDSKQIYISLDTLQKYRTDKSTFREYSFTEGDKLRIVSHRVSQATTQEEDDLITVFPGASDGTIIEFDVVGVELLDRTETNPIAFLKNPSDYSDIPMSLNSIPKEHLGVFVVVENPKIISGSLGTDGEQLKYVGFDWYHLANTERFGYVVGGSVTEYPYPDGTVADNIVNWYKNCIVEIYSPRPSLHDEFWYEISEARPILPETFIDPETGLLLEFPLPRNHGPAFITNNGDVHYRPVPCYSPTYAELDTVPGNYDWFWEQSGFTPGLSATNKDSWSYRSFYLESFYPSDIIGEKMWDRGRPHVKFENAKTFTRFNQVTYSDAYNEDSRYLPLSSFNPTIANFYSFESKYGALRFIENYGMTGELLALQENKLSITPVNKSIIEDASGQQNLALSTNVLNTTRYFVGDFGCSNHPEAVLVQDNDVYFVDASRKKVMRFAGGQLVAISDKSMASVFEECFDKQDLYGPQKIRKIISGYDPSIDVYYVTFLSGRKISWNGQDVQDPIPTGSKLPLTVSDLLANGATFSYHVGTGNWVSRHFFVPEIYSHLDNTMYSCRYVNNVSDPPLLDGQDLWLFEHSLDHPRAYYYFRKSGMQLSCVSNQFPSASKTFDAVSIEGDGDFGAAASFTITNQGTQSGLSPKFVKKEGVWYTRTGRDISVNSTSALKGIGVCQEVDGNTVVLSNSISGLSIANYNALYFLNNGVLESITGDPNTIGYVESVTNPNRVEVNNPVSPSAVGNIILTQSDSSINGDAVRGQWCEIVVTRNSTQQPISIYAINAHFTESKYGHG